MNYSPVSLIGADNTSDKTADNTADSTSADFERVGRTAFSLENVPERGEGAQCTPGGVSSSHADPIYDSMQVRSRYGRSIRPLDRLIQTMSRQDVVDGSTLHSTIH